MDCRSVRSARSPEATQLSVQFIEISGIEFYEALIPPPVDLELVRLCPLVALQTRQTPELYVRIMVGQIEVRVDGPELQSACPEPLLVDISDIVSEQIVSDLSLRDAPDLLTSARP